MVIGIIVLHLPLYQPLADSSLSFFDFIKAFFSHGVFRATVPVLTVMSGFLIFRSNIQTQPIRLFTKKVSAVFIPLVIWNIPFVAAIFLAQKYDLVSHHFSAILYPFDPLSWLNALTGFLGTPANYPLNFLRDLFAVSLLSPLYWFFLKKSPYVGLLLLFVVYFLNLDGSFVLRNSMLISFYIGGLAFSQKWDLTYFDKHAKWLLILFLIICASIVLFKVENRELFKLISPFLVWPSISLIVNTRLGGFLYEHSHASFFTFLAHGPIILILWLVFQKIPLNIPYQVYWFTAPIITVYVSILICRCFKRWFPKLSALALGGR